MNFTPCDLGIIHLNTYETEGLVLLSLNEIGVLQFLSQGRKDPCVARLQKTNGSNTTMTSAVSTFEWHRACCRSSLFELVAAAQVLTS